MGAVKVQIFGQTYTIRGELDERYVQKLAAYVDEKMSAIADVTATVDTQKVAVLAALAIAAYMMHAPVIWIAIGALALLGIAVISAVGKSKPQV